MMDPSNCYQLSLQSLALVDKLHLLGRNHKPPILTSCIANSRRSLRKERPPKVTKEGDGIGLTSRPTKGKTPTAFQQEPGASCAGLTLRPPTPTLSLHSVAPAALDDACLEEPTVVDILEGRPSNLVAILQQGPHDSQKALLDSPTALSTSRIRDSITQQDPRERQKPP